MSALGVSALAIGALSFALLRTSYAGVTDDSAVQAGVAAFPDYLRKVARAIVWLGVGQFVALFAASAGIVLLRGVAFASSTGRRQDGETNDQTARPPEPLTAWAGMFAIAVVVHLV